MIRTPAGILLLPLLLFALETPQIEVPFDKVPALEDRHGVIISDARREGVLTLSTVLSSVAEKYPLILFAERQLQVAEYELLASRGAFDAVWRNSATMVEGFYRTQRLNTVVEKPTPLWGASFFAGYRTGRGNFAIYDGKAETNAGGEFRAGLNLPLLRNRATDANRISVRKSDADRDLARYSLERQRIELARLATLRYYAWVAAGQEYVIMKDLLELAEARARQIEERVALGDLPAIERIENDRAILAREAAVVSAKRTLQRTAIDLSILLRGDAGEMIVPVASELPEGMPAPEELAIEPEKVHPVVLARRPDIREFTPRRLKLQADVELARNQYLPQLDVVMAGSQDFGKGSETRRPPEFEASLIFSLPLETNRLEGRLGSAESQLLALAEQERFARDRVLAEIRDAKSDLEATALRVEIARREYQLAKELENLENQKFELGDSSLLFVNLREQTAAEAAIREIKALQDHQNALANWKAVSVAFPVSGSDPLNRTPADELKGGPEQSNTRNRDP